MKNEEKLGKLKDFKKRITLNGVNPDVNRDTTLNINDYDRKFLSLTTEERLERVKAEIKETIQTKNKYKNSCINLMAFLHEIDPIYTEVILLMKK